MLCVLVLLSPKCRNPIVIRTWPVILSGDLNALKIVVYALKTVCEKYDEPATKTWEREVLVRKSWICFWNQKSLGSVVELTSCQQMKSTLRLRLKVMSDSYWLKLQKLSTRFSRKSKKKGGEILIGYLNRCLQWLLNEEILKDLYDSQVLWSVE